MENNFKDNICVYRQVNHLAMHLKHCKLTMKVKLKVVQSCPTLCDPMDYSVHGILQARILEWVAFPWSGGIFPTQESNPGLLHHRWILYQLSHKGSPFPQGKDVNYIPQ